MRERITDSLRKVGKRVLWLNVGQYFLAAGMGSVEVSTDPAAKSQAAAITIQGVVVASSL